MRILLLLLLSLPVHAQQIQFVHSKYAPAYTQVSLEGPNPFTWRSATFPYTVPDGKCLNITDVQLGSKFPTEGRASYLVLANVLTIADSHGSYSFRMPVIVPGGNTFSAYYINNDAEGQWMSSVVTGYLSPEPCGGK